MVVEEIEERRVDGHLLGDVVPPGCVQGCSRRPGDVASVGIAGAVLKVESGSNGALAVESGEGRYVGVPGVRVHHVPVTCVNLVHAEA